MGGSSLAPEVIAQTAGVAAHRSSTRPRPVRCWRRSTTGLAEHRLVVSSKSGSTRRDRLPEAALRGGVPRRSASTRSSASSSSPTLVRRSTSSARADGYRVFNADPNVGGRYSALTAFGLVPTGLAGVDIARAARRGRRDAARGRDRQRREPRRSSSAPRSRARRPLPRQARHRHRRHPHRRASPTGSSSSIAESTGKDGNGILPGRAAAGLARARRSSLPTCRSCASSTRRTSSTAARPRGEIAHQRVARRASSWSGSTRRRSPGGCSGSTRSTSPTSSRPRSRPAACSTPAPSRPRPPSSTRASRCASRIPSSRHPEPSRGVLDALWSRSSPADGYVSIQAYVDRLDLPQLAEPARARRRATADARPPSAGDRASCTPPASSTRADPRSACSCRSSSAPTYDLEIPDRPFTFGQLIQAQAAGDASVLAEPRTPGR